MSEIQGTEIREPKLKESDYKIAVEEARKLLETPKETISPVERKRLVSKLINEVYITPQDHKDALKSLMPSFVRLAIDYPLSDQQIGKVVRAQRILGYKKITTSELIAIHGGDWEEINRIFNANAERRGSWEQAEKRVVSNNTLQTVYRGMWLHNADVDLILKYGFAPAGLGKYLTIDQMVLDWISFFSGAKQWGMGDTQESHKFLAMQLPLSPVNLLHQIYASGAFGTSSPFKLGVSTTTIENLERLKGRFFGNYLFRIHLPATKLIATKNEGQQEDEHTVLYYIPPSAITGHTHVPENYWKSPIDTLPPHSRFWDLLQSKLIRNKS